MSIIIYENNNSHSVIINTPEDGFNQGEYIIEFDNNDVVVYIDSVEIYRSDEPSFANYINTGNYIGIKVEM